MFFKRKRPAPTPAIDQPGAESNAPAHVPAQHNAPAHHGPANAASGEAPMQQSRLPDVTPQRLQDVQTVKLVEEVAEITKRAVPNETVIVDTVIDTELEAYSLDLRRENYRVERVAKNEVVTTIPSIRKENDVTIIPVLEERLVTIKEIVLREEIHLHAEHSVETEHGEVELRKQRAVVERKPLA